MARKNPPSIPCSIDSCTGFAIARGYCNRHWRRWKQGWPPEKMTLPIYPNRTDDAKRGWMSNGYRFLSTSERGEIAEHRYLMEKYLGRVLDVDEIVHHKNGIKTDNRFENLEIVARGAHTAIHRGHSLPCLICGENSYKGSYGLCSKHVMRCKSYIRKHSIKIPDHYTPKCTLFMGLALAMDNPEVLLRIGSLYGR